MREKREKKCGNEWGRGRGKKGRRDKRKEEESRGKKEELMIKEGRKWNRMKEMKKRCKEMK